MAKQNEEFGKKCTDSGKAISRDKRYYRNGQYFANKTAFVRWNKKQQKENEKAEA